MYLVVILMVSLSLDEIARAALLSHLGGKQDVVALSAMESYLSQGRRSAPDRCGPGGCR